MNAATDALLSKSAYYLPVYAPRQLVLDRGQGARVWDVEGREFIDLAAGIAVCSLGHNDADLKAALLAQADKLWHVSNVFYTEPALRLAEELVTASKFAQRLFFCNSGAEANEVAIKLVRKWAANAGRDAHKRTIITCRGSFHGRTLGTVTPPPSPSTRPVTSRCPVASATSISTMWPSWKRRWPAAMWLR
jgi:Ornithine/acetylornithine aminotransferase